MFISVSKFNTTDQNSCPLTVYARISWEDTPKNLFSIEIYEKTNSWSGQLTLMQGNKFKDNVEEVSSEDPCKATFKWKIKYDESSAVITHGMVQLTKDNPAKCKSVLIDHLIDEQCAMQDSAAGQEQKIAALEANLQKYKEELENLAHTNSQLEASLYSKFLNLLNSRKLRMAQSTNS